MHVACQRLLPCGLIHLPFFQVVLESHSDYMLLPAQIIQRKRDGNALIEEEIRFFINGFTSGELPEYQMSALAMAICFQGMNFDETMWLTRAMIASGKVMQWKQQPGLFYADKHST